MSRRTNVSLLALFLSTLATNAAALGQPAETKSMTSVDPRVNELLQQMTLEEKLGQLTQQWGGELQDVNPDAVQRVLADFLGMAKAGIVGSFLGAYGAEYTNKLQHASMNESRLKIPLIIGNDVIHGFRTVFPVPLAEAATWDPVLVERAARIAAIEARAGGTHWTFAPMVDVSRDPRWGRIVETSGEDPHLSAIMAAARVRGFQGESLKSQDAIMACAKHFVAYGGAEGGRDYNTVDISDQTLREIHLPSFKAAVDAGVGSIMSAFNEINGVPASANRYTLETILRGEMGFNGFVVSDWGSVTEMIAHGFAADPGDAAQHSIRAGVDMDMSSFSYRSHLAEYVKSGKLDIAIIDRAVGRVLRAKAQLGLFDEPYADVELEKKVTLCEAHRIAARETAGKSMVLLKNDKKILPLSSSHKRIAVIGPMADNNHDPLGTWALNGRDQDVVSVLDGLKKRLGDRVELTYEKGSDFLAGEDGPRNAAVDAASKADVALLFVGESEMMTGEAHCRADISLPEPQLALVKAVLKANPKTVVVLFSGRPLTIPWIAENVPAVLAAWHPGVECGNAVADVLFGDVNPAARLPVTWPRHVGQVPLYYNHKNTGRPPVQDNRYTSKYIDMPWTPQYPFGYGLSYASFAYSDLKVTPVSPKRSDTLRVEVTVRNTGDRDGDEVVQLYIQDVTASCTRPVRELKAFRRITIERGAFATLTLDVPVSKLGFYDSKSEYVVEPGKFRLWVGPNSSEGEQFEFEVIADE